MSSPTNCLTCRNWARTDDKLVGLCVVHQGYRFQLEDCAAYVFGEAREVMEPAEIPAPKARHDMSLNQILIEQNANRIMRWHAEGKSRWWMAQMIGMPVNNSNAIARWLKAQGAL